MSERAKGRILVVDDDREMCQLLEVGLGRAGFAVAWRTSAADALALLAAEEFDAVVTDLNMRGASGLDLCARVLDGTPEVPVVVITAFGSLESAVAAIRAGAYDFITKPFDVEALALTLGRAVQHRQLREEVRRLRLAVAESQRFEELLGASDAMKKVYELLARVADADAPVLVTGESGTGKELVARALHRRGRRKHGPFVPVNCSALPEALLESELFGHARGAFTDARTERKGLFQQAHGGTLFLDEIADMPLAFQPRLLRALQEHAVRPVGADSEVPVDVQVIAATHRDLESAVEERRFRQDLYFRINVVHVELPPLRARGGDVLLLAQSFIDQFAARAGRKLDGLQPRAAELLLAYPWPGNVRELRNCIERAVALCRYDQITVDDLPDKVRTHRPSRVVVATDDPDELVPLEEIERRYILKVMEALHGNKTLAARVLGLDRRTLYRKLERWGVTGD